MGVYGFSQKNSLDWMGEKVTKSKEEGGLGLQAAKGRNIAMLSKLKWRFRTKRDAPWVQVLKMKYSNQRRRVACNENHLP